MLSARLASHASPTTAVLVRLAAALVALATLVVVPWTFVAAATGHQSAPVAFAVAAIAAALTLATSLAARGVDPLRQ